MGFPSIEHAGRVAQVAGETDRNPISTPEILIFRKMVLLAAVAAALFAPAAKADEIDNCLVGNWDMFEMQPSMVDMIASSVDAEGQVRVIRDSSTINMRIEPNGSVYTTWHENATIEVRMPATTMQSRFWYHHEEISTIRRAPSGAHQIATLDEPHGPGQGSAVTTMAGEAFTTPIRPSPATTGWMRMDYDCRPDTLRITTRSPAGEGSAVTVYYHRL